MSRREYLNSINNLIDSYSRDIDELREKIIEENVSNYPIFIFQKSDVDILGKLIIPSSSHPESWNVFITHLEELYHKKVIKEDKIDEFKFNYKENSDKFCVISIPTEHDIDIVFIPKKIIR